MGFLVIFSIAMSQWIGIGAKELINNAVFHKALQFSMKWLHWGAVSSFTMPLLLVNCPNSFGEIGQNCGCLVRLTSQISEWLIVEARKFEDWNIPTEFFQFVTFLTESIERNEQKLDEFIKDTLKIVLFRQMLSSYFIYTQTSHYIMVHAAYLI